MSAPLEAEVLDLTIGSIAHGGHFLARAADGRVVFVRHALPGERVRALVTEERSGYLRADAVEILTAAVERVAPPCPWAGPGRCGGCDLQHASPAAQRALKADVVREQLVRLGGFNPAEVDALGIAVRELPGADDGLNWRTRVQYTVDSTGRAGLLKHRSHEVVPIDWCRIAHPLVRAAGVLEQTWPTASGLEVVASAAGETTVLADAAVIAGPDHVRERAIGREWTLDPRAFWQVHPTAAETLATAVVRLLEPRPAERAWDLYGGAGLFAAALAPHLGGDGRITVVESEVAAILAAGRSLEDFTTVRLIHGSVERFLAQAERAPDIVVLDPPRSGAGRRVVEAIAARSPRAIAYVACDPAAFARDARTLVDRGYGLRTLEAYDLFPMTHHVELVAIFVE